MRRDHAALLVSLGLTAVAATMPLLSQGCIALVCFQGDPCSTGATGAGGASLTSSGSITSSVTGVTASTSTASNGSTTGSSASTMSTTSSGAGGCSDPQSCGAPGIDCLGGACHAGQGSACFCDPVAIDLGGAVGRVAVGGPSLGRNVYVPVGAPGAPAIDVLPLKFAPSSVPTAKVAIADADGFIVAFANGYAYSPKTDPHLLACDTNNTCAPSATAYGTHVTGLAFGLSTLFFAVPYLMGSNQSNGIGSFTPFSVPLPTNGTNGLVLLNDSPEGDLHTLRHYNGYVYWVDLGGCLRAFADNSSGSEACIPGVGALNAADLAVGPLGATGSSPGIFVPQVGGGDLHQVTVSINGASQSGLSDVVSDGTGPIQAMAPIAADSNDLYVSGTNEIRVYTYMMGGSPLLVTIPTPGPVVGMDASEPKYLFYSVGSKLYRWTKPKP